MIITLACLKGGVGKSTLASNLAAYYHSIGKKVILVEADPENSSLKAFVENRLESHQTPIDIYISTNTYIEKKLKELEEQYEYVICDTPPNLHARFLRAIRVSDLVIVPFGASMMDIETSEATVNEICVAHDSNPKLKVSLCLNKVSTHSKLAWKTDRARMFLEELAQDQEYMDVLNTDIRSYSCYEDAFALGLSVMDLNTQKAKDDFKDIISLVDKVMNNE